MAAELPIVDPDTTGLIVVGASKFANLPEDPERSAFHDAKERIVRYFKDCEKGFGLLVS